jgi:sugar phosphate permease
MFCYVILTPFSGYLTDRFGAKVVITVCSLILGIGVFLMGTVDSLWKACLFFGIVGIGATGMWTPVLAIVLRWFAPNRRGMALGILSTGYGLGFATMGVAFPCIVHHFSWRHSWFFLGVGAFLMLVLNGVFLRSDPESAGYLPWGDKEGKTVKPLESVAHSLDFESFSKIFRSKPFWLIGLSYCAIAYSFYGITTFMVDYAANQLDFPMEKASLLATIHGTFQIVGVLTILPLSDYLSRKKTLAISEAIIAACLFGILMGGGSWAILAAMMGIMAVFFGAVWPLYGACAGDYFPKRLAGTVMGVWTLLYGMGALSVHWVNGLLRDTTGRYNEAFLIGALMALTGAVLLFAVRVTPIQEHRK